MGTIILEALNRNVRGFLVFKPTIIFTCSNIMRIASCLIMMRVALKFRKRKNTLRAIIHDGF
jgi:hypothetical protein